MSLSEPHTSKWCGKKIICIVCMYIPYVLVLVLITLQSLPALILRVFASFVNSKTIYKLKLLSEMPVNANICVATCPLSLEVTHHMDRPLEWPHR